MNAVLSPINTIMKTYYLVIKSEAQKMALYLICHNFLNNGLILKIQSSTESAKPALLGQSDNLQVSLIRTNCWGQTGADFWKFTVLGTVTP